MPRKRLFPSLFLVLCWLPNLSAQWQHAVDSTEVRTIAVSSPGRWILSTPMHLLAATDGGSTVDTLTENTPEIEDFFTMVLVPGTDTLYFAVEGGVYRMPGPRGPLEMLDSSLIGVYAMAIDSSGRLFASGSAGLLRSRDAGASWESVFSAPGIFSDGVLCTPSGRVYVASIGGGVFRSSDGGASWDTLRGLPDLDPPTALAVSPTTGSVFAAVGVIRNDGARCPVYRSTDDGDTWQMMDSSTQYIDGMFVDGDGIVYAGGTDLRRSTDEGQTWNSFSEGMPLWTNVYSITRDGDMLLAGADVGLFVRPMTPTSVGDDPARVDGFELLQNYPNPFNPTTTIGWRMEEGGFVKVSVTDILGREVAVLVNGAKGAGVHTAIWNAEHAPAGVYFYRLQMDSRLEVKRMVLLR